MSPSDWLVRLAYELEESHRYRRFKHRVWELLEDPHAPVRPYFDIFMMTVVLVSVFLLLYSVKHQVGPWAGWFEDGVVTLFVIEYLARLWVYDDVHRHVIEAYEKSELVNEPFRAGPALWSAIRAKWRYMTTPLAIVDLLAILPSYRPLRILRIFLLFRLFKLFRYAQNIQEFATVFREKRLELFTLFTFLTFILLVGASAIYLFEAREEGGQIDSFFESIYWALVTLSTVGYGDITPNSAEGRLVTMVLIIGGLGVISFFTSIVVSAFQEKLGDVHDRQVATLLQKKKGYVVICGFGRVGEVVAGFLEGDHRDFVVVDDDEARVSEARRRGYLAVRGRAEELGMLRKLGVGRAAGTVLCLTGNDVANVYATLTARQLDPGIQIISRANHHGTLHKLMLAGADHALEPYKIVGLIAGEYVGQPVAFEAIHGIVMGQKDIALETVRVPRGSWLDGRPIGEVPLADFRLILFGVITPLDRESDEVRSAYDLGRLRFQFNPGADFVVVGDDLLLVFGHKYSVLRLRHRLKS